MKLSFLFLIRIPLQPGIKTNPLIPTIPLISCIFIPLKFRSFLAFFIPLNFRSFLAFSIPLKFRLFRSKKCKGFERILLNCPLKFRSFLAFFPAHSSTREVFLTQKNNLRGFFDVHYHISASVSTSCYWDESAALLFSDRGGLDNNHLVSVVEEMFLIRF